MATQKQTMSKTLH